MTIRDLGAPLAAILARDFGVRQGRRTVVGVAGETGSGKSVTADALAWALGDAGVPALVLHQDDYFVRPPRTNHEHRRGDLSSVGPQEVNLALLAEHIAAFRARRDGVIGPRVDYPANRFVTQQHDFAAVDALVVEGTYVLGLDDLDVRVFLEATHLDTADRRRARDRDIDEPFVQEVLAIEHEIIRRQAERADLLVDREFAIRSARSASR
jgi:uridine kinase